MIFNIVEQNRKDKPKIDLWLEEGSNNHNEQRRIHLMAKPEGSVPARRLVTLYADGTLYLNQDKRYSGISDLGIDKNGRLLLRNVHQIYHDQKNLEFAR